MDIMKKIKEVKDKFVKKKETTSEEISKNPKLDALMKEKEQATAKGEPWHTAIKPEIALSYYRIPNSKMYFKFVVADSTDVDEVTKAVAEYNQAGIDVPVYIMPLGGRSEEYKLNTKKVAELAMARGWRYTPRLHVDIFGNAWGT